MKKLMTLMLALSFMASTVVVAFGQEPEKKEEKKKKGGKKKGGKKKGEEPKKEG